MKVVVLIFLLTGLFSCSKLKPEPESYPQKWVLVRMSSPVDQSISAGNDMEWQEYYRLHADGTFVKARTRNETVIEARGTFVFFDHYGQRYLELVYDEANPIISSCSPDLKEHLMMADADKLIGTWAACDGPGLEYQRME